MNDAMKERWAKSLCGPSWDAQDFNETPDGSEPEENRAHWLDIIEKSLSELDAMGMVIVPREPTRNVINAMNKASLEATANNVGFGAALETNIPAYRAAIKASES